MSLDTMQVMEVMHRSLDATDLRQTVIANNIANIDVPNYKRKGVRFESTLSRALHPEPSPRFISKKTRVTHIGFGEPENIHPNDVNPGIEVEIETEYRNDGSNVDIDHEMGEIRKNAELYEVVAARVASMYSMINNVIQRGGTV